MRATAAVCPARCRRPPRSPSPLLLPLHLTARASHPRCAARTYARSQHAQTAVCVSCGCRCRHRVPPASSQDHPTLTWTRSHRCRRCTRRCSAAAMLQVWCALGARSAPEGRSDASHRSCTAVCGSCLSLARASSMLKIFYIGASLVYAHQHHTRGQID